MLDQFSLYSTKGPLSNLALSFVGLQKLIVAIAYITGVALVVRGIMMYRIFANQTYGSAQRGELAGPLVFLIIGAVLIYFPTTMHTSVATLYGSNDIMAASELVAYNSVTKSEQFAEFASLIAKYLRLIGFIAFVRGWIILSKMGHQGSQPGSIGKGVTHVISGVLLINIIETVKILATTFGFNI